MKKKKRVLHVNREKISTYSQLSRHGKNFNENNLKKAKDHKCSDAEDRKTNEFTKRFDQTQKRIFEEQLRNIEKAQGFRLYAGATHPLITDIGCCLMNLSVPFFQKTKFEKDKAMGEQEYVDKYGVFVDPVKNLNKDSKIKSFGYIVCVREDCLIKEILKNFCTKNGSAVNGQGDYVKRIKKNLKSALSLAYLKNSILEDEEGRKTIESRMDVKETDDPLSFDPFFKILGDNGNYYFTVPCQYLRNKEGMLTFFLDDNFYPVLDFLNIRKKHSNIPYIKNISSENIFLRRAMELGNKSFQEKLNRNSNSWMSSSIYKMISIAESIHRFSKNKYHHILKGISFTTSKEHGNHVHIPKDFLEKKLYGEVYRRRRGEIPEINFQLLKKIWKCLQIGFDQLCKDLSFDIEDIRKIGIIIPSEYELILKYKDGTREIKSYGYKSIRKQ